MGRALAFCLLLSVGCTSTVSDAVAREDAATAVDADDVEGGSTCPRGEVYVYDPGCNNPAGRCVPEILDASLIGMMTLCFCDGTIARENTGARRPYRSSWPCAVDAGSDTGSDANTDAGGVCCPLTGTEGCLGTNVYVGGWSPSMGGCQPTSWSNGLPMQRAIDSHGCPVLQENRSAPRCGLLALDAGADVPPGAVYCTNAEGTSVVDLRTNPNHCGGCGRRCCGRFCIEGRCTSDGPPGSLACPLSAEEEIARGCFGDVTIEPSSDRLHCGSCDRRCAAGEECSGGECLRSDAGVDAALDAGGGDAVDG